jgi:hypothetical protein
VGSTFGCLGVRNLGLGVGFEVALLGWFVLLTEVCVLFLGYDAVSAYIRCVANQRLVWLRAAGDWRSTSSLSNDDIYK